MRELELGGVDIAYLNAGIAIGVADLTELTDELYTRIMRVNVDGVVYGTRAAIRCDAGRGGGAIVATSSLAGLIPFPPDPVYDLTKHAVVGFIRSAAPTLAPLGHHRQHREPGHDRHQHPHATRRSSSSPRPNFPLMAGGADRGRGLHDRDHRAAPASAGSASRAGTPSRTASTTSPGPGPPGAEGRRPPQVDDWTT